MAFDTHRSRVKALEKLTLSSGPVVAVFLPGDGAEERAVKEEMLAEARARGREVVEVRINLGASPAVCTRA